MHFLRAIIGCLLLLPAAVAAEPPLTIAAAADLNFALSDLAAAFQKQTGTPVRLTFGSSGNLFMQISNGAPFDLFFSADMEHPRKLQAAGFAVPGTLVRYASGKLALVVPVASRLLLDREGMNVLLDASARCIAIANPQHAPYGRAAVETLRYYGVYEKLSSKLVIGENVAQAAQFVQSGNAQAGLVALSLALAPGAKVRYWIVPPESYAALDQGAVVLKNSRNETQARRFLAFLKTPAAIEILKRYGFTVPEAR